MTRKPQVLVVDDEANLRRMLGAVLTGPPERPPVAIELAPTDLQGRPAVQVTITDGGPGIAPDAIGRVFEPYFTTKASGLGLGLVLTKKIVDAHGGEIFVDSTPGKGTRIEVALPAGFPAEGAPG